ncbi:MAG: VgrG-related protein [Actinomycetota bacterium]|nr:VgrG-related protein [Actinomycetota bacterium]
MSDVAIAPSITLGDSALSITWQAALLEVRIDRQLNVPSRVTLRFLDPGYSLLQSQVAALGKAVRVVDPRQSSLVLVDAEVTAIACEQRPGEQPELLVEAHDRSHRLGRATQASTYTSMSPGQVVESLAEKAGLSASVTASGETMEYLLQVDSDLGLLGELARRQGCDWWVDTSATLHYGQPSSSKTVSLTLGDDLLSFSARASGQRPDSVTVDGWDRDSQSVVSGSATQPSTAVMASSTLASMVSNPGSAFGSAALHTSALGAQTAGEATQLSQAILNRQAAAAVEASGVLAGDGRIEPGMVVDVSGAGPLSGTYPVTAVEHVYRPGRGYRTRFTCGDRQPTGLVTTLGAGGGAGLGTSVVSHAGLTVGQVTNINDPANKGRVKVQFPGLSGNEESAWARIAVLGGGVQRGNVFIPEVDDEVLVAFEGGDTRAPVVIGGLYGQKSTIPTPDIADGKVQKRQIASRLGHTVSILDGTSPATEAIELTLAGGNSSIHLGKDKLAITVPSGTPVSITAGSSSLQIANSGAVTLQGSTISIKAEQQLQLQAPSVSVSADTSLSLEGQVSAALKGAQVQVQSEGPASITGTPVSIN